MTSRDFNKVLNACRTKAGRNDRTGRPLVTRLDLEKVRALDDATKRSSVEFLVRNRGPVLTAFLPTVGCWSAGWLESCGYLYLTTGKETGLTFLHTGEHEIR